MDKDNERKLYRVIKQSEVNGFAFISQRKIAKEMGLPLTTVHRMMDNFVQRGIVAMKTKGVYELKGEKDYE